MSISVTDMKTPEKSPLWHRWLGWRLVTTIVIKLCLLTTLWYFFFAHDRRPPVSPDHLSSRFIPANHVIPTHLQEDSVHD